MHSILPPPKQKKTLQPISVYRKCTIFWYEEKHKPVQTAVILKIINFFNNKEIFMQYKTKFPVNWVYLLIFSGSKSHFKIVLLKITIKKNKTINLFRSNTIIESKSHKKCMTFKNY